MRVDNEQPRFTRRAARLICTIALAAGSVNLPLPAIDPVLAVHAAGEPGLNRAVATLTYPGAKPCDRTLQLCIDGAAAGDTINIQAGTYVTSEVFISKTLTLNGAGVKETILGGGGAHRVIQVADSIPLVRIRNMTVMSGFVALGAKGGAGLYSGNQTPVHLDNVTFLSNTLAATLPESGGGAYLSGPAVLTNTNFIGNFARNGAGGGLRAASSATITRGEFRNNHAYNPGGGLRVTGPLMARDISVISNTVGLVVPNTNEPNGGGIRADGTLDLLNSLIQGNRVVNNGGGLHVAGVAHITGTQFTANEAADGGGLYALSPMTVSTSLFSKNVAAGDGGGAYTNGPLRLSGSSLVSNTAEARGGGLRANATASIVGVALEGNRAISSTEGVGGAAYFAGEAVISKANVSKNRAGARAGGLRADSALTLLDVAANENGVDADSRFGPPGNCAAMEVAGKFSMLGGEMIKNVGSVVDGTANVRYPGLVCANGGASMRGVFVAQNSAGGVQVQTSLEISNSIFLSNTVGLGVLLHSGTGGASVINNLFARNIAELKSGDVSDSGLALAGTGANTMHHNTLVGRNTASPGALVVLATTAAVDAANNLFADAGAGFSDGVSGTPALTVRNSLFANVPQPVGFAPVVSTANKTGNAGFAQPSALNFHITGDSDAEDIGLPGLAARDADGNVRPQGAGPDAGYDEIQLVAPTIRTSYLPMTRLDPPVPPCDGFEPNDSRFAPAALSPASGTNYAATLCSGDLEDNYIVTKTATGNLRLQFTLAPELRNHFQYFVYDANDLSESGLVLSCQLIGAILTAPSYDLTCPGVPAGPYLVRIYTDDGSGSDTATYGFTFTY